MHYRPASTITSRNIEASRWTEALNTFLSNSPTEFCSKPHPTVKRPESFTHLSPLHTYLEKLGDRAGTGDLIEIRGCLGERSQLCLDLASTAVMSASRVSIRDSPVRVVKLVNGN